jgi:hypothetical protein
LRWCRRRRGGWEEREQTLAQRIWSERREGVKGGVCSAGGRISDRTKGQIGKTNGTLRFLLWVFQHLISNLKRCKNKFIRQGCKKMVSNRCPTTHLVGDTHFVPDYRAITYFKINFDI